MGLISRIKEWTSSHNPKWLAFIRAILGVFIFMRGVSFLENPKEFHDLILSSTLNINNPILVDLVPWIHIVGGFLILIGLLTRLACLVQIPIVLVAIFFINANKGLFSLETDLAFSIVVLLLLILFVIEGGGPISIIRYLKDE